MIELAAGSCAVSKDSFSIVFFRYGVGIAGDSDLRRADC